MIKKIKTDEEYQMILENIQRIKRDTCKICGSPVNPVKNKPNYVRCSWKTCRKQMSAYKTEIFNNRKIPGIELLKILDCWLNKLTTSSISFVTGISKKNHI